MTEQTTPDERALEAPPQPAPPASHTPISAADERRNNKVIWLLVASTFVVFLNETTMGVALKPIMDSMHVDERAGQWLTTAFLLTMAVVIPITGFLLQRFNTRPIYIAAMTLFSVGTALALFAPSFSILLIARVVQASGTAIMMPLLMTTLMTLVPPHHRGKMMGNVSIVMSVAPAIGPTFSGLMLNSLGWRGIFGVMLPIGIAMLAYGFRKVENVSEPTKVPLDVLSVVLSAIGFGGLIYGLSTVGQSGDGVFNVTTLALTGGAVALVLFVLRQLQLQRTDRALLDLRTFRFAQFTISLSMMLVMMASLFGVIIVLPLFMLGVLHLDPVEAGLILLPGGLLMGLIAPFIGRLFDRFGPRPLLVPGSILVSAVLWSLTTVSETTPVWFLMTAHIVMSLGLALIFTPLFTSGLGAVSPKFYSHASATLATLQQLAGAAGTALFITVLASQTAALAATGVSADIAAAGGTRAAFTVGAIISLFAIVGAFFVKKPADMEGSHVGH